MDEDGASTPPPSRLREGLGVGARPPQAQAPEGARRHGKFRLNRPTQRAKELRNNPTEAEKLLWSRLRKSRLAGLTFTRQLPVAGHFGDFGCRKARLIVELDGSQHIEMSEADAKRTRRIKAEGYRVIRFWNNDLTSNMDGVLQAILAAALPRLEREPTPVSGRPSPGRPETAGGGFTRNSPPASVRGGEGGAACTPLPPARGVGGGLAPSSKGNGEGQN